MTDKEPQLPNNQTVQAKPDRSFDDKLDKIVVMAVGGAFLGCAVGQLPGAIIGSLAAAAYGIYVNFSKS